MSGRDELGVHVLVTGFGPFEDVRVNASGLVAAALDGVEIGGVVVRGVVLPTAFGEARAMVAERARAPGCIGAVALGVWRGHDVRLERRAHGVVTSERADVRGEAWLGRELGAALTTTVPVDDWAAAIGPTGSIGLWVSEDCGGYVCNAVYQALLAVTGSARPALFMHLPRDVGVSGLAATEAMVRAVVERVARVGGA